LVQALIEREVRKSMKKADIEKIFIYPEDSPAAAPTTSVILDRLLRIQTGAQIILPDDCKTSS